MQQIPQVSKFDSTSDFLAEGYTFFTKRFEALNTDVFQTRLMLKKVICLRGEEAAIRFYDTDFFMRKGAAPSRVQKTLFGQGGVQGLDGKAHRHRKNVFMSLMTPENIRALTDGVSEIWEHKLREWEELGEIDFFYEAHEILCRAACVWAGVGMREHEVRARTHDTMSLIDSASAIGLRHWRGRRRRKKMNNWARRAIRDIRTSETMTEPPPTAALAFAEHRELNGALLNENIAAVELLNVIRPTVAVARYFAFIALTLHQNAYWRDKVASGGDEEITLFVQEVRRYYPFFPSVAAITKKSFDWHGYHFPEGRLTLLDLYGTNHDPRSWEHPEQFRPERFYHWNGNPFNFVAQGGGSHNQNHRCAGEWLTIELMKLATRFLTRSMRYQVPPQDLAVDLRKMPALPGSGFKITNIKAIKPLPSQLRNHHDGVPNQR